MIYWINGAYGVGKSTVAEALCRKLPKAHIFDAEEVGNAVRDNYPEKCKNGILFENYVLWRELNYKLLKDIYEKYEGDILVPMTLTLDVSYVEIIDRLRQDEIPVCCIILDGDWQTIHDRILQRGESESCWCMQNISMCLRAQQNDPRGIHVCTVDRTPEQIAEEILKYGK